MIYFWVKAVHIIAVIAWMAGLLYLPRLFVYHTQAEPRGEAARFFEVMERRLLTVIMTPAMIVSWILGLSLFFLTGGLSSFSEGWVYVKFAMVLGLTGYHFFLGRCVSRFTQGENRHSEKFYRVINEAPTLSMIVIVIMVVVKPF